MKVQTYVVCAVIVGALLLTAAWWFGLGKKRASSSPPPPPPPVSTSASNAPTFNNAASATNVPSGNLPAGAAAASSPTVDSKTALMLAFWAAANQKSLDFFGKIIDQNGEPVGGVKVTAGVGLIIDMTHSGAKYFYTQSDSTGKFSFNGIRGAGVGFVLQKEGYTYNQRQPSSSRPNDYTPDPNNPVIFKMWKLNGAEPMIHARVHAYVPCDGTSVSFNLLTGRSQGDLTVTLTRNPVNIDRSKPFDWALTVGVANGGLVENTDTYPNEAPTEGYQPSVTISMPTDDKKWTSTVSGTYYFKNGQTYGRMTINVMANFQPPPTLFDADIYANPSGSRNLEFDSSKQINQ